MGFSKHSSSTGWDKSSALTPRTSTLVEETGDKMTNPNQTQDSDNLPYTGVFSGPGTGLREFLALFNLI